jgi:hypothetical protein
MQVLRHSNYQPLPGQNYPSLGPNEFPLTPITFEDDKKKNKAQRAPARMITKGRTKPGPSVTQLPCVPAFALTGHKCQGATLSSLVVGQWHRARDWTYVVLSRVRTLTGLYLMSALDSRAEADASREAEMNRLRSAVIAPTINALSPVLL